MFKSFNAERNPIVDYVTEHSVRLSEAQKWLIEKTLSLSNHIMMGSADEIQFLANLCKLIGAKKTLDIGVYTGYSALSIASVLPEDGKVYALDVTDEYLKDFCEPAWEKGNVKHKINFMKNPALENLNKLLEEGQAGTFDFAFIDADKTNYENYYEICLKLIRRKGVIAIDNVIWSGKVSDPKYQDETTVAIRNFNIKLRDDIRVDISMLAIADGVTLAFKK